MNLSPAPDPAQTRGMTPCHTAATRPDKSCLCSAVLQRRGWTCGSIHKEAEWKRDTGRRCVVTWQRNVWGWRRFIHACGILLFDVQVIFILILGESAAEFAFERRDSQLQVELRINSNSVSSLILISSVVTILVAHLGTMLGTEFSECTALCVSSTVRYSPLYRFKFSVMKYIDVPVFWTHLLILSMQGGLMEVLKLLGILAC